MAGPWTYDDSGCLRFRVGCFTSDGHSRPRLGAELVRTGLLKPLLPRAVVVKVIDNPQGGTPLLRGEFLNRRGWYVVPLASADCFIDCIEGRLTKLIDEALHQEKIAEAIDAAKGGK